MDSSKLESMIGKADDELEYWSIEDDRNQLNFWLGYRFALNELLDGE